jgi:hypothetical protein
MRRMHGSFHGRNAIRQVKRHDLGLSELRHHGSEVDDAAHRDACEGLGCGCAAVAVCYDLDRVRCSCENETEGVIENVRLLLVPS